MYGRMLMFERIPEAPTRLLEKLAEKAPRPANRNSVPSNFMMTGSRNTDLTRLAGYLRGQMGMDQQQMLAVMKDVNQEGSDPLPEDEVESISRSVSKYEAATKVELDDIPLADLLAHEIAKTSCRTPATGWMQYDGKCWVDDDGGSYAKEQIKRQLQRLAGNLAGSGHIDDLKTAKHLLTAAKVKRIFDLVSTDSRIVRQFDEFDLAPGIVNLSNGTLDLVTGELRPHSAADLLTKKTDAPFDPQAACPEFDRFLRSTLTEEEGAFVLRLFGYALLGTPTQHVFAIFHGPGRNGKSTLADIMAHVFGDYARNAEPSTFIKQKGTGARNDLARLKGARMVATSEVSMGEFLDTALVKRITGGDIIAARALYREHFEFKPEFVMFMTTNVLPVIDGGDKALERRLILVPFKNVLTVDQCDHDLPTKLKSEASGILNRIQEGLTDYGENGLNIPRSVKAEIGKYIEHSDLIQNFLDDRCELKPGTEARASELYQAYVGWSSVNGTKPCSQPTFKLEITKRTNIQQTRTNKGNVWPGMSLRPRSPSMLL
jgi:putative DNA primase/helicase